MVLEHGSPASEIHPRAGAAIAGASRLIDLPTTGLLAGLEDRLNIGAAAHYPLTSDLETLLLARSTSRDQ